MNRLPAHLTRQGNLLLRSKRWRAYAVLLELARRGRLVHDGTRWTVRDADGAHLVDADRLMVIRLTAPGPQRMCNVDERLIRFDGRAALAQVVTLTSHGYFCLYAAANIRTFAPSSLVEELDAPVPQLH